jgi:bacteriocin-like protein
MFELSESELEQVIGGRNYTYTSVGADVQASAGGGNLGITITLTRTESNSVLLQGESVSSAVGFALAIAI